MFNLQEFIDTKPYKIDLAVINYQDEGYKLEMFIWKDDFYVSDVITISTGNSKDLHDKMIEIYNALKLGGITCNYNTNIETC